MKLFLVSMLLFIGLFSAIFALDLLMGMDPYNILLKTTNPFRVMENAEYFILILFFLIFIMTIIKPFLKRKQKKNQPPY